MNNTQNDLVVVITFKFCLQTQFTHFEFRPTAILVKQFKLLQKWKGSRKIEHSNTKMVQNKGRINQK